MWWVFRTWIPHIFLAAIPAALIFFVVKLSTIMFVITAVVASLGAFGVYVWLDQQWSFR